MKRGATLWAAALALSSHIYAAAPIDREAVVRRHSPTIVALDPLSPFSVGNGRFVFTADVTGLQTFPAAYSGGIPLHTESEWGWHSFPNTRGFSAADATRVYDVDGRKVPYLSGAAEGSAYSKAGEYLRANPHRIDLGQLGLILRTKDGRDAVPQDISAVRQTLDLWAGVLESRFRFDGEAVSVRTAVHPELDLVAAEIESPLVRSGQLGVAASFPGPKAAWGENTDWTIPDAHQTEVAVGEGSCVFARSIDATKYGARLEWSDGGAFERAGPHRFVLFAKGHEKLSVSLAFSPDAFARHIPAAEQTFAASSEHWQKFWRSGGAIDLSASKDPRWRELERRIVLSQYLTALQCDGSMPPQETGLTANSWYGRPHLEMHWWHAAHFALWGRPELLERSLPWYQRLLSRAKDDAAAQGYKGARWPKMVGPDGESAPSKVAVFLIWQQPHPIYYAELLRRENPSRETLEKYKDIVFATADFMASYARWDDEAQRYVLGPVMIPAQESYGKWLNSTINPTFELSYWRWGLQTAQAWRAALGMKPNPEWQKVLDGLSPLPVRGGLYCGVESEPYTLREDHPSMLGALGMLPGLGVDPAVMAQTYDDVRREWDWGSTWGWDYPLMAMTAARLGRAKDAVDALLTGAPKNTYLPNGHNYQEKRLPLYLPGNGGLLAAVAMMAAGWDGSQGDAPGFPKGGGWNVRHEGLRKMP